MKNDLTEVAALEALLCEQRHAYRRAPYPSWETRAAHLRALRKVLLDNRDTLADAMNADFGNRARQEVLLAEFLLVKEEIDAALRHGKRWMKAQRRSTNKWLLPARAKVVPQPLGVVGIIVPWNYPVLLAAGPLISALTAGNRAIIKMSELTPRTSALFEKLISETFARDHVAVVNGDAALAAAFSAQPFDHLLFTGSTKIGHEVMRAAAANLTPVTLELGGKSPAVIGAHARFENAVDNLIAGKTLNAGQTCVAPDYVLVPRGKEQAFIERARVRMAKMYPGFAQNPDYTSIISPRHFERLERLADEASAAGAQLHPLTDCAPDAASRRFPPVVVTYAPGECALMQEEIFGPLLPIVAYDTLDEAIAFINARPRPLALYLYADDAATIERVTHETVAGGMAINETLMHLACESLPFGGVGASGMGAYHGYEGFVTFSKMKPVLTQARLNARGWIAPPYGRRVDALLKLMMRF
ncbi:coniferyl aldehyde dehydrogenase [bacterium M00.F.Ca.ET.228.01.1.1]|uniref:coniferyl aldehyde dehydrogenase n=1 Tax=Paraburkholderia phenoliruptrix TaxID=252970 RepID=UPI00109193E1|nr:coniferyl aldehyde dehydrogenase [Paraburkholderia phenoliruptrix]TGP45120.1 coniferyl aldehyde dehydrogenase [bacterium M00.F.Ca.ET.228.01.1.1]TGS03003.1 coniferyl aldehyde dehydrogenase [bacterium M00.F.Ca.ET.191.01.1.1]TGU06385.1 coniferyl aldehyde dehydrogenase [bacterium M00.F.Ca.ET.155.01.1.1]MBW0448822.1 coniferyl aldehyde dehydrogenase [Paraburkholderia phenoliruptrix]MBW9097799.1 coniferyl aldehyde dehydrogenase [Paraburkholderia phenoliruptrix]